MEYFDSKLMIDVAGSKVDLDSFKGDLVDEILEDDIEA